MINCEIVLPNPSRLTCLYYHDVITIKEIAKIHNINMNKYKAYNWYSPIDEDEQVKNGMRIVFLKQLIQDPKIRRRKIALKN